MRSAENPGHTRWGPPQPASGPSTLLISSSWSHTYPYVF